MKKDCEYLKNGHCILNECMYGDFMDRDDEPHPNNLCYWDEETKEQKENE